MKMLFVPLITLLIDDEFLGAFMERAKAYERLIEEAIESYARTIELDDATSTPFCV
jgi:hypothetical protein